MHTKSRNHEKLLSHNLSHSCYKHNNIIVCQNNCKLSAIPSSTWLGLRLSWRALWIRQFEWSRTTQISASWQQWEWKIHKGWVWNLHPPNMSLSHGVSTLSANECCKSTQLIDCINVTFTSPDELLPIKKTRLTSKQAQQKHVNDLAL
jgi:hypothetical protein